MVTDADYNASELATIFRRRRRIVFEFDRAEGSGCSVELMNADGSGLVDLTGNRNGCGAAPSFTPDGSRIVFERFDDIAKVGAIWS